MATDNMSDLQSLVDSMRLTGTPGPDQIDKLASAIENRLNLNLGRNEYRSLAEQMMALSISRDANRASPGNSPQKQQPQWPQGRSSAFSSMNGIGGSTNRNENAFNQMNASTESQHQFSSSPQQPMPSLGSNDNEKRRRGRSPARSTLSSSNKTRDCSTNSAPGLRVNSPIRNFWGGSNKIPPAASKQAEPRPRNSSPSPLKFFKRPGTKSAVSSPEDKKGQEEKKDQEKHDHFRPGMRDQSPGASPQRLSSQRCPSPLQPQGTFFSQPPKHSFQPASPVRPPISASRPSTPVHNERSASRCSSPFAARPGLQEDEDGDSLSISGRSPVRSFPPAMSVPQNVSNVSSGMSSHHHPPGMPLGRHGHRRTHSGGVDLDKDSIKPIPPRAHSRSPMRRPSPTEDDGDRQPVPPRAFSMSPRGRAAAGFAHVKDISSDQIRMPDLAGLSMPDFNPTAMPDPSMNGETMFTPPPRVVPPSWAHDDVSGDYRVTEPMSVNRPASEDSNADSPPNKRKDDQHCDTTLPAVGLRPRPALVDPNDMQFRCDFSTKSNLRSHLPDRLGSRRSMRTDQPPPRLPPVARDQVFSPMDVDEPSPVPPAALPPLRMEGNSIQFAMGVSDGPKPRFARVRRPISDAKIAADIPLPRSAENSFSSQDYAPTAASTASEVQADHPNFDFSGKVGFISIKRKEAKNFYMTGDYRSSITSYTEAIKIYSEAAALLSSDTVAVLLSNRAAGLLMVGAYEAAVSDCQQALRKVTPPRSNEPFSNDSGLLLKIKLSTRLARAHLKLGEHVAATDAFNDAIRTANDASAFSHANHSEQAYQLNQITLSQMVTEATLGLADSKRLRDASEQLTQCTMVSLKYPNERSKYAESLGHVNLALSIASGSVRLIESKLALLVQMKRWREVAGFCERFAAFNVGMDQVFVEDLESKNPFPGVSPAQVLKADFFGNLRDEDATTRDLKLNSRAAAEAVLRLPYVLTPIYLRALRLEERYPAADAALRALEELVRRGTGVLGSQLLQSKFSWLLKERNKLERTKEGRELGDELFRLQDFDKAAAKYAECLSIDSDGIPDTVDSLNAGGRLHAVLHCNRAACLMALRRFHGAVEECSNALKIHSRYMKAILRRARCYTRLQRTQEAISEYKRWLDLVEEARKSDYAPLSPCLFDGPHDVKPTEVTLTQKELDDLHKAKRRADATAREEADRLRDRERQRFSDNFSSSWRSTAGVNAQDRRDQWYNEQSGSRRWDSFTNRGPRSSSNPRPESGGSERDNSRSNSQGRPRQEPHVSPRSNTSDHYSILNLRPNATVDEIKKSFRRLALKYHPDKNNDGGAVDNFRRVKLAHEILSDPVKRRQYDAEIRLDRPF